MITHVVMLFCFVLFRDHLGFLLSELLCSFSSSANSLAAFGHWHLFFRVGVHCIWLSSENPADLGRGRMVWGFQSVLQLRVWCWDCGGLAVSFACTLKRSQIWLGGVRAAWNVSVLVWTSTIFKIMDLHVLLEVVIANWAAYVPSIWKICLATIN